MRIIGVDLHTRQQSVAMLDTDTGEVIEKTLEHEGAKCDGSILHCPGRS